MEIHPAITKIDTLLKATRSIYYTANKQKQNLSDKEWFATELKITESAYRIAFSFTVIFVGLVVGLNLLGVFEIIKLHYSSSSFTLVTGMISLVMYTSRLKAKQEELRTGNYLLELREDILNPSTGSVPNFNEH